MNNNIAPTANINNIGGGVKYLAEGATLSTNMGKICGIYKITNPKGKIYIGQSIDCLKRFRYYERLACKEQPKLFFSLKKYGWQTHKAEIIDHCLQSELNDKEIYYIELYQCYNSKHGLNLKEGGSNGSHICTEEARINMRNAQLGKKQPPEQIAKRISKIKGLKRTDEFRQRLSFLRTGTHPTPETLKKLSESHKGIRLSEAAKKKLSVFNKGKKGFRHTDESKRKLSIAKKGIPTHNKGKKFNSITRKYYYFEASEKRYKNHISQQTIKF